MNKERLDKIIENINTHNLLQSFCGGMTSYDCAISELAEYALNLNQALIDIREYMKVHEYDYVYSDCKFIEIEQYKDILEKIDKVLGGSDEKVNK